MRECSEFSFYACFCFLFTFTLNLLGLQKFPTLNFSLVLRGLWELLHTFSLYAKPGLVFILNSLLLFYL